VVTASPSTPPRHCHPNPPTKDVVSGIETELSKHVRERSLPIRGYTSYVAQGGDWGASIVQAMGRQAPAGLLGIHTNFPATIPNEVGAALGGGPCRLLEELC